MTKARLLTHFRGLTWADIDRLRLDEFRALVAAMNADVKARNRQTGARGGTRRVPAMT